MSSPTVATALVSVEEVHKASETFLFERKNFDGEHNYGRGAEPGAQARLGGRLGPPGFIAYRWVSHSSIDPS